VSGNALPDVPPPVSAATQQRGVDFLQGLLAEDKIDLDQFRAALDGLHGAADDAAFAAVVRSLPAPVQMTSPGRRRQEPLEITAATRAVRLVGRWQVGRRTRVEAEIGSVTIDLCDAEFDDREVDLVVRAHIGSITIIVPRGVDVRLVGVTGPVELAIEGPIPGFPVVRLSATADFGSIKVVHPKELGPRRRFWRRRSRQGDEVTRGPRP
jgi:hypothetical protein